MAEWSPPTSEIRGSNLVVAKLLSNICWPLTVLKIQKIGREWPIFQKNLYFQTWSTVSLIRIYCGMLGSSVNVQSVPCLKGLKLYLGNYCPIDTYHLKCCAKGLQKLCKNRQETFIERISSFQSRQVFWAAHTKFSGTNRHKNFQKQNFFEKNRSALIGS